MEKTYITPLYALLIFSLVVLTQCNGRGGSGAIDGIELGRGLWLDLENIELTSAFNPLVGEKLQPHFISLPSELDSLRIYKASTNLGNGRVAVKIILIPIERTKFAGSYLAINVLESGKVERVRIWGNDYTDKDTDTSIENFYRQFDRNRGLLDMSEMMKISEIDEFIENLDPKSRYLYEHRPVMLGNAFIIRSSNALRNRDKLPNIEWYETKEESLNAMLKNADLLADMMDHQAITEYKKVAKNALHDWKTVVGAVKSGASTRKVRGLVEHFRVNCGNCHNIKANASSETSVRTVGRNLSTLGYKDGIYRVGFDLWSIPGDRPSSQYIADLVKVGVFYLSYLSDK